MYASYEAAVMPRHLDLAEKYGVNLLGAVTWAFEFEDQPYFDGFRDLATNGIDKPVLNVFRMLGMMTGDRAAVENPAAASLDAMLLTGVKEKPDIHAMASVGPRSAAILVSNYHDSAKPGPPADIDLAISGLPSGRALLQHYRVDDQYSNSYELWKQMGSPPRPTPEQYAALERAGQLHLLESPRWITAADGRAEVRFGLPLHGVSLVVLAW
jgi:xylan 1,4-beta-xylosidase